MVLWFIPYISGVTGSVLGFPWFFIPIGIGLIAFLFFYDRYFEESKA